MASEKRCLYEVLGLHRDCTPDEIRSAYKKLALQRHPDKLVQSGLSQANATAQFQELVHAYEVLSDPKERSWYDSHRSQILFSDPNSVSNSPIPNLFSYFSNTVYSGYSDSGRGFFNVYSDLFTKIYSNEMNFAKEMGLRLDTVKDAPLMGNLESSYSQVTSFYNYWLGFCTVMDFCWADEYDVMAGPNRKSRRVMEEENKKLRRKAKREYNETVRGLAEFVRKRDKRVIDMSLRRKQKIEEKREEEKERKKQLEREKMERARAYEEPEWAKVADVDVDEGNWEEMEQRGRKEGNEEKEKKELYCVACGKKFKSEKQWKNHEQSKKHKEKVAELRESFFEEEEQDDLKELGETVVVDEVFERFRDELEIGKDEGEREDESVVVDLSEEDGFFNVEGGDEENVGIDDASDDGKGDEEMSILDVMVLGHRSGKHEASRSKEEVVRTEVHTKDDSDEEQFMDYNYGKRRNRRGKKERSKKNAGEAMNETKSKKEEANVSESQQMEGQEASSHAFSQNESFNGERCSEAVENHNNSKESDNKGPTKKDTNYKSKNVSKGRKAKATTKHSWNMCETCGEAFQSRNKLHQHLDDTGHATLKFR
ncbi:hypothetical protein SLEP1_g43042 [Rubroshorea leprosula]|uniref:DNAJ protein JJJ1 homolog n=1 Tax=Rubroshorea leprosula TaxID=152421 RepID=A0AAV5LBR2_9ROSI|nr:hypothetical protein SLEP1_g43042 [Rubroshorea leprosula]